TLRKLVKKEYIFANTRGLLVPQYLFCLAIWMHLHSDGHNIAPPPSHRLKIIQIINVCSKSMLLAINK
ncbi:hypothetical protein, partial [Yersinia sp. 2542 StPb PI]|uniref:hypothetical protein n=1 Tax=Yersinia sp. 2542 StPb PI TaxID=3117408 RepID=UPI003B28A87C